MKPIVVRGGLAAALSFAVLAVSGCSGQAQSHTVATPEKPRGVPVEVALVQRGQLAPVYEATATLEAVREATLLAEVAGEVVSINVEEGDRVSAGQILARVDSVRKALELRQVQSVANRLTHEARRNDTLIQKNMISREAFDRTRYDGDTQAAVVNLARLDQDKTAIRAPYAGIVTRRFIKQGQWLKRDEHAFAIADFDSLQARIEVPERSAGLIKPGAPVRFIADAIPGQQFNARVQRVAPVIDRNSGTLSVVIAVANPAHTLRPGQFVRAAVNYELIADALLMPRAAVIDGGRNKHVFVVRDGKAVRQTVALGVAEGDRVQVLDGVDDGASVVVVGQSTLIDGARVEPLQITPVAARQAPANSAPEATL